METKDDLELFMKQLLVNDPTGNIAISYQSLLTEMAKMTNSPKTLLESLDINEKWLTIKNLSKILVVSKTKNSLIKLHSAEEIGALGNKYEFKGIVGGTIEYVFDLDRNRDESVKGEDYYKLTMKQPRRNELLIQRAWINDPLRLISMMEQLIMS